jgi:hypothetical protein
MKTKILSILFVSIFLVGCGSSGGSSGTTTDSSSSGNTTSSTTTTTSSTSTDTSSDTTTVTAVDGYIKNATVKDSTGQIATYSSNGQYTFESSAVFPITLTGGELEDTNASFDIEMSAQNGSSVISPITTFIGNDSDILSKFANLGLGISTQDEFAVDYVADGNTNLAKLSQMLYLIQKNENLTSTFKTTLSSNSPASLDDIFTLAEGDVNSTITSTTDAQNYRTFLSTVKDYNGTASDFETTLKNHKYVFNSDILDENITHNGTTYGMVVSPKTGKIWLDRNLGASRVCTANNDQSCYGDYYSWGREHDGHQESNSTVVNTKATDITNVGSNYIAVLADWSTADTNGSIRQARWASTDGSSICPKDFRVPTEAEWIAETDRANFNSFLKIPLAGSRFGFLGFSGVGTSSNLWSNTFDNQSSNNRRTLNGGTSNAPWDVGLPIRCIRD